MTKIGFKFPEDNANKWRGFNTAGIATFAGHRFRSLAREIAQNSLDARNPDLKDGEPVRLSFDFLEIPVSKFPDVEQFKITMKSVKKAVDEQDNDKARAFVTESLKVLNAKTIKVLRITDTNTTGLRGPCEVGTPYYALLKAEGQSLKSSDNAGGSYGIGKYAPFTLSKLRTVFFSTTWQDENGFQKFVQGKSILTSHNRGKKRHDAEGYWGKESGFEPVSGADLKSVPEWLLPVGLNKTSGTSIFIVGFNEFTKSWRERIAGSVAESFFRAIKEKQLEVNVDGKYLLSSDSLDSIFTNEDIIKSYDDLPDAAAAFKLAHDFLSTLDPNLPGYETSSTENVKFGEVRLHLRIDQKLPKRVGVVRNGMLITDRLNGLKRLSEFKPFVALLTFQSDKGNRILRQMEPPAHDAFEPSRIDDDKERRAVQRELNKIAKWVREQLGRFAKDAVQDTVEVNELAELFPDDTPGDAKARGDDEVDPRGKLRVRSKPLPTKKRKNSHSSPPGGGSGGDAGATTTGGQNGNGTNSGGGEMPEGGDKTGGNDGNTGNSNAGDPIELTNVRAIKKGTSGRSLFVTPPTKGEVELSFSISGADTDDKLTVSSTSVGKVVAGNVRLTTVALNRINLDIEFTEKFEGTLKVIAHAV